MLSYSYKTKISIAFDMNVPGTLLPRYCRRIFPLKLPDSAKLKLPNLTPEQAQFKY